MLESLGWESLEAHRRAMDLTLFYKIQYDLVGITLPPEVCPGYAKTRGHRLKYRELRPDVNVYKFSFFPRTIKAWNTLSASAVEASTLAVFKTEVGK